MDIQLFLNAEKVTVRNTKNNFKHPKNLLLN